MRADQTKLGAALSGFETHAQERIAFMSRDLKNEGTSGAIQRGPIRIEEMN
jgi:hypothetical protein